MRASNFFDKNQKRAIVQAIQKAELETSGEVRVHIETSCRGELFDRAAYWFGRMKMQKTKLRNGVLFYLALSDRKFAIIGDAGINAKVPPDFWNAIKESMGYYFQKGQFTEGLSKGIEMAGDQLKVQFPYQSNDKNELKDKISFGW